MAQSRAVHDGFFDEDVAASYDLTEAEMFEPQVLGPAVDFLSELAGNGRVLEFGIGTGRVAVPLAARGLEVSGIDVSAPMLRRLQDKPGGDRIEVAVGDFSSTRVEGSFRLVYLVFNTIMNLTTQEAQVACFENASRHLEPGGRFVIEVGTPSLRRLPPGETVRAFEVTADHLGFDEFHVADQRLVSHHYRVIDGAMVARSVPFRFVWPSELDLMARISGMELEERCAGWGREPFTDESTKHISVWRKVA